MEQNKEELTLKDLQNQLVELGMSEEDATKFSVKSAALSTIELLNKQKKVDISAIRTNPVEEKNLLVKYKTKAERMREVLLAQPTVRSIIQLTDQEKPGVVEWHYDKKTKREEQVHISGAVHEFISNGYIYLVPKGVYVDVPQQIGDDLQTRFGQGVSKIAEQFSIDRIDPQTGKAVAEQL